MERIEGWKEAKGGKEERKDERKERGRRRKKETEFEGRVKGKARTRKETKEISLLRIGAGFSSGCNLCQSKRDENQVRIHGESVLTIWCAGRQPLPTVDKAWIREQTHISGLAIADSWQGGLAVSLMREFKQRTREAAYNIQHPSTWCSLNRAYPMDFPTLQSKTISLTSPRHSVHTLIWLESPNNDLYGEWVLSCCPARAGKIIRNLFHYWI